MAVASGPVVVEHFNVSEDIYPGHVPRFVYLLSAVALEPIPEGIVRV